jgi:hypothetical protein
MAVTFWPTLASATINGGAVATAPLSKATTGDVDETDRLSTSASGRSEFTLNAVNASVGVSHGGITSVKMHFRLYYSNNGTVSLDEGNFLAYVAPYVTVDGVTYYNCPEFDFPGGVQSFMGYAFGSYTHNFNLPGEPVAKIVEWDITSLASWDNAKLSGLNFGLKMTGDYLGPNPFRYSGWAPDPGGAGNAPRYNFTQLMLQVAANDPPPPPVEPPRLVPVIL